MRWTYSDHHFVQNSFVWYKPTLRFLLLCVFSRKWVRKGASECQSRHDVLLPKAPRIRDWTIQDSNRVSFQNPLDLLHLYPVNLNARSHCRWTKGVVESHSGITDQTHPLFFRNYTPLIKNNTSPSLPSPYNFTLSCTSFTSISFFAPSWKLEFACDRSCGCPEASKPVKERWLGSTQIQPRTGPSNYRAFVSGVRSHNI